MKKYYHIFWLSVLAILGCEKDELEQRGYPVVITKVEVIQEGAVFKLELLTQGTDIVEKGFYWGSKEMEEVQIVLDPSKSEYFLRTDIPEGERFYVRAYAKTKDYLAFGEDAYFESKGFLQKEIVVEDFAPKNTTDMDHVKIWGDGFSWLKENVAIEIGGVSAEILSSTSDTIVFKMPNGLPVDSYDINLSIYSHETSVVGLFVKAPEITELNLNQAFDDTEVVISGSYFAPNSKIFFGEMAAEKISISQNEIVVKSPLTTTSGLVKLFVQNSNKNSAELDFTILDHQIETIEADKFKIGNVVTVTGTGFEQLDRTTTVNVEGANAEIVSISNSQIEFRLPNHNSSGLSKVQVINGLKIREIEIQKEDSWIRLQDFPGTARVYPATFSYGGYGFIGIGSTDVVPYSVRLLSDFWKYDPVNDSWLPLGDFPGNTGNPYNQIMYPFSFSIGDKGYVGFNYYSSNQSAELKLEIWEYDFDLDQWNHIKDFVHNDIGLNQITVAVVGGKAYLKSLFSDFYIFDPIENDVEIEEVSRIDENGNYEYGPFIFNIQDDLMLLMGFTSTSQTSGNYKIYYLQSDLILDSTIPVSSVKKRSVYWSNNGNGYFGGGTRFSQANPDSKVFWEVAKYEGLIRREDFYEAVRDQSAIVINGKAYLGFGLNYSVNPRKDFWLFDPN